LRWSISVFDGETLKVNGEPKALRPATNGYASLKLPPVRRRLNCRATEERVDQTLDIAKPGTWLVNP
jgi:hypothetical protein